ncbi:MAG: hypothetical protein JJ911_01010 [Rhizobiaceae bacterium]|nr:hypothetical protein [Rhizobiaceae bacterium]
MSDERMARPVSGEIMTDGRTRETGRQRRHGDDVIDADFETILPDSKTTAQQRAPQSPPPGQAQGGMDMLRSAERPERRNGGPVFWIFGLALVFGAFWVSGGHAIVSRDDGARQDATSVSPFKQPLRIVDVVSRIDRKGERSFLMVDGAVNNPSDRPAMVPPLAITVTGLDGRETYYYLGTNERTLGPGQRFDFSSRLRTPNGGVRTVTVDFKKEGGN